MNQIQPKFSSPSIQPDSTSTDLRGKKFSGIAGSGKSQDIVLLDAKSSGEVKTGQGNDTFDYNSGVGTLNTTIDAGEGFDTLSLNKLKASDALNLLKKEGYSLVLDDAGFRFRTKDNQEIVFRGIEELAFSDVKFDLTKKDQFDSFAKAVSDTKIPIIDERGKNTTNPKNQSSIPGNYDFQSLFQNLFSQVQSLLSSIFRFFLQSLENRVKDWL